MRILILVDCYLPSTKSGAKQIHDLGVELRCRGQDVTVLAPSDAISAKLQVTTEDGLQIVRVKTPRIKHATKALRAIQEIRLSALLWRGAKSFLTNNAFDWILFYSPTIFLGELVRKLKKLWRCPAYLILRDIFPEWAVNAGLLRKGLVYRFFRRKESEQYAVADVIAVQSPANLEYFARAFPERQFQLEILYNWARVQEPDLVPTNYRAELGLQAKVVFFYGGNIGLAQDIDNIVRLAVNLAHHNHIYFLLVGEGSEVAHLRRHIAGRGLRNIQMLPAVSQQEYISMLAEFDVGLISLDRRLTTHNLPGKMLGYMYWGMPILASVNPGNDLSDLIQQSQAGFCFVNGDDKNLSEAALRLADDSELRARLGKNSRRLLEQIFSVQAAAQHIMEHLSKTAPAAEQVEWMLPAGSLPPVRGLQRHR